MAEQPRTLPPMYGGAFTVVVSRRQGGRIVLRVVLSITRHALGAVLASVIFPGVLGGCYSPQPKLTVNEKAPVPRAAGASSQTQVLRGSQLTPIPEQIARCRNVPANARGAKDPVVEIRVIVDPDGTVRQATIVDQSRLGSDPVFRSLAESARRAFFNPLCRPLHLPPDKYAIWRDLIVKLGLKDIS